MREIGLRVDYDTQAVSIDTYRPTVSVLWDRAVQQAVIAERTGPTIASRAYAMTHTAIYDAWAQFDPHALATTVGNALQQPAALVTDAMKNVAMSHAAHDVLIDLFPTHAELFRKTLVDSIGYDPALRPPASSGPEAVAASIGRQVAAALLEARADDGANAQNGFADPRGYTPANSSARVVRDIERWTPESVPIDPERDEDVQVYLTPHWGEVEPFALPSGDALRPPPPERFFLPGVEAELGIASRTIRLADGSELAVSRDLVGTVINPGFIAQAERVVEASAGLTAEQKLIAEFWEDGPGTSFPPGTWMTFGQYVSARDGHTLDDDARMFMALANAGFDVGIATWEAKHFYDYARPVRAIRSLGKLGLIGEEGIDSQTGEHGFVIDAWAGTGEGTKTILASRFSTYQPPGGDASPPFAEFTSGHSGFSAAGAFILQSFTGGPEFGAAVTIPPGHSRFESKFTPIEPTTLSWDTFFDAADQAGLSRIFGGIHFDDGDRLGRALGVEAGELAWRATQHLVSGQPESVEDLPPLILPTAGDAIDAALTKPILPGYLTAAEAATLTLEVTADHDDLAYQLFAYTVAEDRTFADLVAVPRADAIDRPLELPLGVVPAGTEFGLLLVTDLAGSGELPTAADYRLLNAHGEPASIYQGTPPELALVDATGELQALDGTLHFAIDYDLAPGNRLNSSGEIQAIGGQDDGRLVIAFEAERRDGDTDADFADLVLVLDLVPVVPSEPEDGSPTAMAAVAKHDPRPPLTLAELLEIDGPIADLDAATAPASTGRAAVDAPAILASLAGPTAVGVAALITEQVA